MTVELVTTGATEADLEARANAALRAACPWIDARGLKHQLSFSFQLGHNVVTIDGMKSSARRGRVDILIEHGDRRLAIVELKRPGDELTVDDVDQGLSYARVLHPRPPIVVVSNGDETRVYSTHNGELLDGGVPAEADLARLAKVALDLAKDDLRNAVATLMGPTSDVWMSAVRAVTRQTIEELTGDWDDRLAPFTEGFHFPRKAATLALEALRGARRVVAVEGAPLIGKSHVLRELASGTAARDDMAVLFVDASGGAATGVTHAVAHLMSEALGWRITADEARHWLETLGRGDGPMLVVAVDGLGLENGAIRQELAALTAKATGARLKFVVEADTSVVDLLWLGETRRKDTVFSRRGERIEVELLDDQEFEVAVGVLRRHHATLMAGAAKADEYRQPWLLHAMAASVVGTPEADSGLTAVLPPMLSLDLFRHVRERFVQDSLIEQAATFARAALEDYGSGDRPPDVRLRGMHHFLVRKQTMRRHADPGDLTAMEHSGMVGTILDDANRAVLAGRLPELIASEMSRLIAARLDERMTGGKADAEAADWLVSTTARLPMGDLVAARALVDFFELRGAISIETLNRLLSTPPSVRSIAPGTRAVAWLPGIGRIDLAIGADGVTAIKAPGLVAPLVIADEGPQTYADLDAWLVLSHLAGVPIAAVSPQDEAAIIGLVHPAILALVGTCQIPLRHVPEHFERSGVHTHEAPDGSVLVCRKDGIIEPVTFSMLRFLRHEVENADEWLDDACSGKSAALINRIAQALATITDLEGDAHVGRWARHRLDGLVSPALARTLLPMPGAA